MRLPWDRTKPPQLDLLALEPSPTPETAASVSLEDDEAPPHEVPTMPGVALPRTAPGEPLLVPLSALCEDPDNPRTEFPDAELLELAQDIRQHGVLQPIVVQPADADGRYRIHFGAKRFRAAGVAGLAQVPVTVRPAAADTYAQVAENQKRHGLSPLDLARFIRSRVDLGESNASIARRLGMDLTTVAHHLTLLELPPPLEAALRTGRCAAARTLYELNKVHAERPEAVLELLKSDAPITREAVAALRRPVRRPKTTKRPTPPTKAPARSAQPGQLAQRAERLCTQLASACSQLRGAGFEQMPAEQLAALRERVIGLKLFLEP